MSQTWTGLARQARQAPIGNSLSSAQERQQLRQDYLDQLQLEELVCAPRANLAGGQHEWGPVDADKYQVRLGRPASWFLSSLLTDLTRADGASFRARDDRRSDTATSASKQVVAQADQAGDFASPMGSVMSKLAASSDSKSNDNNNLALLQRLLVYLEPTLIRRSRGEQQTSASVHALNGSHVSPLGSGRDLATPDSSGHSQAAAIESKRRGPIVETLNATKGKLSWRTDMHLI